MIHYKWSKCGLNKADLAATKEIDQDKVTCVACLRELLNNCKYSLNEAEERNKANNKTLHDLANEACWAGSLLRLLIRETGALHKDCPAEGKCLVLDVGFCWVRNYEAVIENNKKRK